SPAGRAAGGEGRVREMVPPSSQAVTTGEEAHPGEASIQPETGAERTRRRAAPGVSRQRPWMAAVASTHMDVRPSGRDTPGAAPLRPEPLLQGFARNLRQIRPTLKLPNFSPHA